MPLRSLFFLLILSLAFAPVVETGAASRYNKSAQALAKQLGPTQPAKNYKKEEIGGLSKRMIASIELLERSYRTSGPTPESLISKALFFREDLGQWEKLLLSNALLNCWKEANAHGLFDQAGKFHASISKGRGVGEKMMFELIVPGEAYPPGSNQLCNVRLVPVDEKRIDPKAMTPREEATLTQLKKLVVEKTSLADRKQWESHKTNDLGQTKEQAFSEWEKEMKAAGEAAKETPNIRVAGDARATPSHRTQFRWHTACEVINNSTHPTEVKVEVWLVGYTWKKRDYYIMSKTEKVLKLRRNEAAEFDVYSKSEGSYKNKADDHDGLNKHERKESKVRHRGYAIRVTHGKDLVTFTGSDKLLTSLVDPSVEDQKIESLPAF